MQRREFLQRAAEACFAITGATAIGAERPPGRQVELAREIGITTGSFTRHLSPDGTGGKLRLLDLPRLMRDELDLRIIDLMTATLPSLEPAYLEQLRDAAARAGCTLTNLKMNQPGLDLGSADPAVRARSVTEYKRTIDAAAHLGVRWVRPLPGPKRPDLAQLAAAYRELIDHARTRGIAVLIENFGWLRDDADAIPAIIAAVGPALKAQPDTGNWTDAVRYAGLEKAFPFAVSCDFKAFALGPDGSHAAYDLKRCFDIGWSAGFRGPWCFEHFHADRAQLVREMALLRDSLRGWMRQASGKARAEPSP